MTLEQMQATIATRIADQLPSFFLDRAIEFHCRKGLRDCGCSYCMAKRLLTYRLSNGKQLAWDVGVHMSYIPRNTWDWYERRSYEKYLMDCERDRIKLEAEQELEQLKQVVL